MTTMGTVSMETSVLRYICAHEERACSSTSISVPLQSPTYQRLSVRVCPSCAIFIAEQALEGLENTFQVKRIAKSDLDALDSRISCEDTVLNLSLIHI